PRRFHRRQERAVAHRCRDPVEPARDDHAGIGLADAARGTRAQDALRHRHEHGSHVGGSRPAVFRDARAHSPDRGQGPAQAEAPEPEPQAAFIPRQLRPSAWLAPDQTGGHWRGRGAAWPPGGAKAPREARMRFLALIGLLAIIAVVVAAGYFFAGFYNVAATWDDPAPIASALVRVRTASIAKRAHDRPPL